MWSHTISFSDSLEARSTSLLISSKLGNYAVSETYGNTSVLPSLVAEPVDGDGPTIVAVHPVAPIPGQMSNWRSDLEWVSALCQQPNLIMAGDFNSTLDHLTNLGQCQDAALANRSAAVGTWPTFLPPLLSAPIDHVLTTPFWHATSAQVIETEDNAGSDHRPIVATLSFHIS
jgi:endonuclease/exonuclease/phosphatase (EEP) superfamily protein YafD